MDKPRSDSLSEAAAWHARLRAPDCGVREREAFHRWLQADTVHASAFAAVQRVEAAMQRAAHDERWSALLEESSGRAVSRRHWQVPLGLAATLLLCVALWRFAPLPFAASTAQTYASAARETREIVLSDGSTVRLDAGSEISVHMQRDERFITLTAGRAFFDVAHDATRPFVVGSRGVRTVALGTQFQVQEDVQRVVVTLLEGSVMVSNRQAGETRWREKLVPGDQLSVAGDGTPEHRRVSADEASAWVRGRHVFHGAPLSVAIDEINRYAVQKVRLGDPTLAELAVGGNFVAGDSRAIVEALCAVLPLRVIDAGPREIILVRRSTADVLQ